MSICMLNSKPIHLRLSATGTACHESRVERSLLRQVYCFVYFSNPGALLTSGLASVEVFAVPFAVHTTALCPKRAFLQNHAYFRQKVLLTFFLGLFGFSRTAFAAGSAPYFTASGSTVTFSHDHSPLHLKLNMNRILVTKPSYYHGYDAQPS